MRKQDILDLNNKIITMEQLEEIEVLDCVDCLEFIGFNGIHEYHGWYVVSLDSREEINLYV